MPTHFDSDAHKGAVENDSPNDQPRSTDLHSNLADQLPHRSSTDSMIKNRDEDNDTDFPEPGRTPEHTGQRE
jgi:hypothetical protein